MILLPQSRRERFSRPVQLGLHGALTHTKSFSDRLDRLVEQVVQRRHLALLLWQSHECVFDVNVEHLDGVSDALLDVPEFGECALLRPLAPVRIADAIARDDGNPGRNVSHRVLGRTRDETKNRIVHSIGRALAITGDEPDCRDNFGVLVRDEVIEVYRDLHRRIDTHTLSTHIHPAEVDNGPVESGYSGTPQWKKLGIKPGSVWDVVAHPEDWRFETEPDEAAHASTGPADVVLFFAKAAADLSEIWAIAERIRPAGALWIAWPRKAAGHISDMTENYIRQIALPGGLVDVKVAALDTDWSALKLVWRLEHR